MVPQVLLALCLALLSLALGTELPENAVCTGTSCEFRGQGDETSFKQKEADIDDVMSMLALRAGAARGFKELCPPASYQMCAPDIPRLLVAARLDPSHDTQTRTLSWMTTVGTLLGLVGDVLTLLVATSLVTMSDGTLASFALTADIGSAFFSIDTGYATQCDARCLWVQSSELTKEFVEAEIEANHYEELKTLIIGAQHRMKEISLRIADSGIRTPTETCYFERAQNTSETRKVTGEPYGNMTSLSYSGATTLCLLLGAEICETVICRNTTIGQKVDHMGMCGIYNHSLHLGQEEHNQTLLSPRGPGCFTSGVPFNMAHSANTTIKRVLGEGGMVDQLLTEMNMQLYTSFTLGTVGSPGKPMPNATMYAAIYASSYFQLYARMIQTEGTLYHLSGERAMLVREIDEITDWVEKSIDEATQTRMNYLDTKALSAPWYGGAALGVQYIGGDNFSHRCWEQSEVEWYYDGQHVPHYVNKNAEKNVQSCLDLHERWVSDQQQSWWALTRHFVLQWKEIKRQVLAWKLPDGNLVRSATSI